jgi:hypothetical protein
MDRDVMGRDVVRRDMKGRDRPLLPEVRPRQKVLIVDSQSRFISPRFTMSRFIMSRPI